MPKHRWQSLRRTAPARLAVFFVVLMAADICCQLPLRWVYHHAPARFAGWAALGAALLAAAVLLGTYAALVRGMEHRKASELAPGAGWASMGALFGLALFAAVIALVHAAGAAQVQGRLTGLYVMPMLAGSIRAAVGEELAFRGGVFRILEDSCGTTVALILSAAIFGLLHALNPGATIVSVAAIGIEAGVLLGAAYAFTRNLWLPIGLHFGWDFTEGGIFGLSGAAAGKGVFVVTLAGPRLLSGGKFGPEASLIGVAVCLTAALVLIALAIKAGRWKPARWRMTLD